MDNVLSPRRTWFRFTLGHLFVLTLGIALGFAPLKLWELGEPANPQVLLHVRVIDVPHDQLAALGLTAGRIPPGGIRLQDLGAGFSERLEKLVPKQAKVLAEPTLMTVSGRHSRFNVGGEVPVIVPIAGGGNTIEYREFGTSVDFTPTIQRNGRIRVKMTAKISEVDEAHAATINGGRVPGFRSRSVDAEVELADRETVVICNDLAHSKFDRDGSSISPRNLLILATVEKAKAR
ncbi:MAG TPA: hypothetical protein VMP01_13550 [Pirellulaceae bacterium]|nr:hypothetical protein [Pirellulaceae bacterium]